MYKLYNNKKTIEFDVETTELDITNAENKATYKEIQKYILEKYKVKVYSLSIAQVKKKFNIEMRLCYNKSKKKSYKPPKCSKINEEYIVEAFRHFQMI